MDQSRIEDLILDGSLEVSGMTDSGDITYTFKQVLEERHPDIYKEVMRLMYQNIAMFWEKGFLNFDFSESDPLVTITDKINDSDALESLSEMEKINLQIIVKAFASRQ